MRARLLVADRLKGDISLEWGGMMSEDGSRRWGGQRTIRSIFLIGSMLS